MPAFQNRSIVQKINGVEEWVDRAEDNCVEHVEKTEGRGRNHDVTDDVHRVQSVFESAQLGLKNLCLGKTIVHLS